MGLPRRTAARPVRTEATPTLPRLRTAYRLAGHSAGVEQLVRVVGPEHALYVAARLGERDLLDPLVQLEIGARRVPPVHRVGACVVRCQRMGLAPLEALEQQAQVPRSELKILIRLEQRLLGDA